MIRKTLERLNYEIDKLNGEMLEILETCELKGCEVEDVLDTIHNIWESEGYEESDFQYLDLEWLCETVVI